ncbi:MAG: long-chain fatty acid--CoA ligase [bacterium]|nr:MAG: long-chain fatty acid--CoA ligase [bacterium]
MNDQDAVETYGTLPRMYFAQAERLGRAASVLEGKSGFYRPISWEEIASQIREAAAGLVAIGVKQGDRVAVMAYNRPEWLVTDLAIMAAGAITIPIYHTIPLVQADRILGRSGARVAFVARSDQAEMLLSCSPLLDTIISLDPVGVDDAGECSMDYGTLKLKGADFLAAGGRELDERIDSAGPGDVATIIYTSGTTGDPKGVMLTHGNILFDAQAGLSAQPVGPGDIHLSFLPLSHVFERTVGQFLMIMAGATIAYATSMLRVADNLPEVKPTVMISVPRFFEKLHTKVLDALRQAPAIRQKIFHWGMGVGRTRNGLLMSGKRPGPLLELKYRIADRMVFSRLKAKLGGRLRFFVSGGAPLAPEIIEFFLAAGIQIMEGYGLTEAAPVVSVNPLGALRPGTVGRPLPGIEVRIAEDGELLVAGPNVMLGYDNDPAATSGAIRNGWLHTGDLAEIEDGYIRITGRKKDILVTSGGKNVSPAVVENLIVEDDLINQVMVYGDGRNFLTALVVPNYERIAAMAHQIGLEGLSGEDLTPEALSSNRRLYDLLMERIGARTGDLASFERVKRIHLLDRELSEEEGELTPTMKVKRKVVSEKFGPVLDALYED